jgi:outer membrane protein assembly factor BamD (BamD/ComL family)
MRTPISARIAFCLTACVLLTTLVPPAVAQQEQYRERQELDPESGEWVEQPLEDRGEPADDLDQAREYLATGKYRKAYSLLKKWTDQNPDHDRYYEGMYLLGEALFERSHFYQAYENYEEVADTTGGELFYKALRREMDVARAFLSGEKRIVWKVLYLPAYDDGIEILDRVWERVPGSRLGELALKLKADYFFAVGDVDLAQDEYVNLAREYPNGRYVQLAMLRGAEAAAAAFPGIKFDDRALLDAQVRYEQLQATFPPYAERERVPDRLEGIRQQRAEKDLDIARWYERTKQAGAAEYYYRLVLNDWPDTLAAGEARRSLQLMGVELAEEDSQP